VALFSGSRTFILNLFLKAELEIMMLHEKMDVLRQQPWTDLLTLQKEQLQMLQALTATSTGGQR